MTSDTTVLLPTREAAASRPTAKGKFFFIGEEKFYVRGVTYGPFRPEQDGGEYHNAATVDRDFRLMREQGINSLRLYTVAPRWLLDLAQEHGLRVLVGLPWEQHVTFLSDRRRAHQIERRIAGLVKTCAGHPALLGYAVGNEIPSPLVRWYGHRKIEAYLERLYWAAKNHDPEALVTYINYPSTEYLELPFLDFLGFNVYLESQPQLSAYLARLQNSAGERPLLMGEIGLDSLRHGQDRQAEVLEWQVREAFSAGCAGLFVFSWTDEWHRGGHDIADWQFGITTADRRPKPASRAIASAFKEVPFSWRRTWPRFSIVICSYNGARTLRACLEKVKALNYPAREVIVVDDGSTDNTAAIASEFDVRLVRIANGGLSNARNIGWQAAHGELVAYLDDDAAPDKEWLMYLASAFAEGNYAGVAGPNVAWPEDGWVATSVDHAPGNPTHVLLTDREAEHLPGCNMAFRRSCLQAVGGFDPQFRVAGDDVDLCWRLQQRGWKLGFHPAAMVWHHRRGTVTGYWRQQLNYGKAEAMLERKWPEKYNAFGHATWNGRLYSKGFFNWLNWGRQRIYHGTWGTAPFQSIYSVAPGTLASILMMPEWYLVIALLAVLSLCGFIYPPLDFVRLLLGLAFLPPLTHAGLSAARAFFRLVPPSPWQRLRLVGMTALLHFLQPAARLLGRLGYGLTPWRLRGTGRLAVPLPRRVDLWSESNWESAEQRLQDYEGALRREGAAVSRGGEYDPWDLEVRGGLLGTARLLMVIEEHGGGKQYVRMRIWPVGHPLASIVASLFAVLAIRAILDLQWVPWMLLNLPALLLIGRMAYECASAMAAIGDMIQKAKQAAPQVETKPGAAEGPQRERPADEPPLKTALTEVAR